VYKGEGEEDEEEESESEKFCQGLLELRPKSPKKDSKKSLSVLVESHLVVSLLKECPSEKIDDELSLDESSSKIVRIGGILTRLGYKFSAKDSSLRGLGPGGFQGLEGWDLDLNAWFFGIIEFLINLGARGEHLAYRSMYAPFVKTLSRSTALTVLSSILNHLFWIVLT
jgi:hypothetical protein